MEIVNIIQLLLTFGVSFVFTALLMPWLIELCRQKGLYDQPNERKMHKNSIRASVACFSLPRCPSVLWPATFIWG